MSGHRANHCPHDCKDRQAKIGIYGLPKRWLTSGKQWKPVPTEENLNYNRQFAGGLVWTCLGVKSSNAHTPAMERTQQYHKIYLRKLKMASEISWDFLPGAWPGFHQGKISSGSVMFQEERIFWKYTKVLVLKKGLPLGETS